MPTIPADDRERPRLALLAISVRPTAAARGRVGGRAALCRGNHIALPIGAGIEHAQRPKKFFGRLDCRTSFGFAMAPCRWCWERPRIAHFVVPRARRRTFPEPTG